MFFDSGRHSDTIIAMFVFIHEQICTDRRVGIGCVRWNVIASPQRTPTPSDVFHWVFNCHWTVWSAFESGPQLKWRKSPSRCATTQYVEANRSLLPPKRPIESARISQKLKSKSFRNNVSRIECDEFIYKWISSLDLTVRSSDKRHPGCHEQNLQSKLFVNSVIHCGISAKWRISRMIVGRKSRLFQTHWFQMQNAFKTKAVADPGVGHRHIHIAVYVVGHNSIGKILLGGE